MVFEQTPNAIYQKARDVVNDIKVAQSNYDLASKDLGVARAAYYPRLTGFLGYNTRWSESQLLSFREQLYLLDGTSMGLQLSVPILNGFSTAKLALKNLIKS